MHGNVPIALYNNSYGAPTLSLSDVPTVFTLYGAANVFFPSNGSVSGIAEGGSIRAHGVSNKEPLYLNSGIYIYTGWLIVEQPPARRQYNV